MIMALLMLLLFHYLLHSRAVHSDAYQTIKEVSSVTFAAATQTTSPSITLRLCGPRLSPAITPVHVHMRWAAIYCALPVDCKCVLAVPCRTIQRVTGHRRWLTWRALALLHSCTLAQDKRFTIFNISINTKNGKFTVFRRYSEFRDLYDGLAKVSWVRD